jgi:GT2 family glycosyltransferase
MLSIVKRRLARIVEDLVSPRGALLAASAAGAVLAVALDGAWGDAAALVAILAAVALMALVTTRQAHLSSRANQTERDLRRVEKKADVEPRIQVVAPARYGPAPSFEVAKRLERARASIASTRQGLVSSSLDGAPAAAPGAELPPRDDGMPLVTVVIPCFNEEAFVVAAMESVRRQSHIDWECIVVDDASTDASLQRVWEKAGQDDRFRVVRHKVNGGLSAARNTGLRLARGRFVTFLDADDLLLADALLLRLEAMAQHQGDADLAGVFCGVRLAPEHVDLETLPAYIEGSPPAFHDFLTAAGECPFNAHAPLLDTSLLRGMGGFDESMRRGGEDWDLWLRIMRNGYLFRSVPAIAAIYRQKSSSMARRMAGDHVRVSETLIDAAYERVPAQHLTAPRPSPMVEPLSYYQVLLAKAVRSIRFTAMALVSGDRQSARSVAETLPPGSWDLLARHVDFDLHISDGFRRTLGLDPEEIARLRSELAPLHTEVMELIRAQTGSDGFELPAPPPGPTVDVLFVPESAQSAITMSDAARRSGRQALVLDLEREIGARGIDGAVRRAGLESVSLNEWVLGGWTAGVLVLDSPRGGASQALADAAAEGGTALVELVPELDEYLRLDEANFTRFTGRRCTAGELDSAIEAAFPATVPVTSRARSGALPWLASTQVLPEFIWEIEEYPDTTIDAADLSRFKGIHRGERAVIIGNGPSLNDLDLRKLADENTIAVNAIFYAADDMGFDPTYYVVEDTAVMADNLERIRTYPAGHKFFPSIYRNKVGEAPNVSYFMMNRGFYASTSPEYCVPRFSTDIAQRIFCGQSVTIINLQLAYYMGFTEVVLIGMDFSYVVPEDAKVDGNLITSMSDDPNHFHPDYFGKGKKWKDPKLDRVLANYAIAKATFEADGRRIVNATAGGRLELFERVPYDSLFPNTESAERRGTHEAS